MTYDSFGIGSRLNRQTRSVPGLLKNAKPASGPTPRLRLRLFADDRLTTASARPHSEQAGVGPAFTRHFDAGIVARGVQQNRVAQLYAAMTGKRAVTTQESLVDDDQTEAQARAAASAAAEEQAKRETSAAKKTAESQQADMKVDAAKSDPAPGIAAKLQQLNEEIEKAAATAIGDANRSWQASIRQNSDEGKLADKRGKEARDAEEEKQDASEFDKVAQLGKLNPSLSLRHGKRRPREAQQVLAPGQPAPNDFIAQGAAHKAKQNHDD